MMNLRLLELLVKEKLLTPEQAEQAAAEQRGTNDRLMTVLKRLGFLPAGEEELLDFLSRKYGIPIVDLRRVEVTEELTRLVKKELAQKYHVFPVRKTGNTLTLALSDPTVVLAIDEVQFATGLHVVPVLASETAIAAAIARHYVDPAAKSDEIVRGSQPISTELFEPAHRSREEAEAGGLAEGADEAPVIRFVNLILADAIRKGASDIHLEPFEKTFRVRYRIDGVLHDVMAPPKQMEAAILSRVKIMANMDIAERRLPQDGRISVKFGNTEVDLRVSSLPAIFGESIVMRILGKTEVVLDLNSLGFEEDDLENFKKAIQTPRGLILVTGPTGSGKSTTLYAALSTINSPEIKIMTAEDPVEYSLPGVIQVHVREDIGMTFQAALRAFLRQDPDVILVSEMRDTETAQIAIRAAVTGQLVFSTLHTNDAPSTIIRLLDMGIVPFLVSSSLLMVMAQRLCRRICPDCREPIEVPRSALLDVGFGPEEAELVTVSKGSGCAKCGNTGYRGRTAIYEVLCVNPELQEAIAGQRPGSELKEIALRNGMRTLRQAGLRKVASGATTLEEVVRVTFAD